MGAVRMLAGFEIRRRWRRAVLLTLLVGVVGALVLSTDLPVAGGKLSVSGTGFAPQSSVDITFESTPIHLATARTDATGAFSVEVTIPSGASGEHQIVAAGEDAQGEPLVLTATVQITSASASAVTLPPTETTPAAPPSGPTSGSIAVVLLALVAIMGGALAFARTRPKSAFVRIRQAHRRR